MDFRGSRRNCNGPAGAEELLVEGLLVEATAFDLARGGAEAGAATVGREGLPPPNCAAGKAGAADFCTTGGVEDLPGALAGADGAARNGRGKAAIINSISPQPNWRFPTRVMTSIVSQPVTTSPFVLYQSERLSAYAERVIHGFTGKPITLGGPGFSTEEIQASRKALCVHTGMNGSRLSMPRQTHTDQARLNDLPCESDADAVILTEPGIPAMVQVADCVPIILYDPQQHVGAVVHAGWRGTAQAITAKVAQRLFNDHGARPKSLIAVIGPSIGGCCYEVSQEVADAVGKTIPTQGPAQFSAINANGKPRVDLKRVNQLQLETLGVQAIECLTVCTQCQPEHLWSYRRHENGRQVAFLQLQPI